MTNKIFMSTALVTALVAMACSNEPSLTSPSLEPAPATAFELDFASSKTLVNLDPLCPGARSPGFYCQNKDGGNPNLTEDEFLLLEADAATRLGSALGSLTVGQAVCIKGNRTPDDQLVRHLAALALSLEANLIDETTPLTDGSFANVGEAFDAAVVIASDVNATKQERNDIKDVLDAINNNLNTELREDCVDGGEPGAE